MQKHWHIPAAPQAKAFQRRPPSGTAHLPQGDQLGLLRFRQQNRINGLAVIAGLAAY
jgi:hypothetical protein